MRTGSLKQKLIVRNTVTLLSVFTIVLVIFVWFSYQNYREQIDKTQVILKQNLEQKGRLILIDKALTLKVYVEENSPGTVREIVEETVRYDPDIVYGGYVRKADWQPWAWVTAENPSGTIVAKKEMRNSTTEWALRLNTLDYRQTEKDGLSLYEFAAPIYARPEISLEPGEEEEAIHVGAIIYGFSTKSMQDEFAKEERLYKAKMKTNLTVLGVLALATLCFGIVATQRQATTITQPLGVLTAASEAISRGDYSTQVRVSSGDEIEKLAMSFNAMTKDLEATYADLHAKNRELEETHRQLENLNKNLEFKIEERTHQLAESESKFRTLFEGSADAILLSSETELLDCNPAMLKMFGYTGKDAFLKRSPSDISPEMQPDGAASYDKLLKLYGDASRAGSRQIEWVSKRQNGEEFFTEIVITSVPLNGREVIHNVFRDITERKRTEQELLVAQQKLVETAHSAGMNEIATGVLHNIGNILNSVNISTEEIDITIKNSKIKRFINANDLLRNHLDNVSEFLSQHPKGRLLPGYYINLGEAIREEYDLITEEIGSLTIKVNMMRDVISTQQNYAKASLYTEDVAIADMVDDAIKLQFGALNKQGVEIQRNYLKRPVGSVPKVKLIHVLTNLIKNGQEAMADNIELKKPQKMIITLTQPKEDTAQIQILDNGCGIEPHHLERIFSHGFTTKVHGHGFGLHTCANFMTEMGGSLTVESGGAGLGAVFTLTFPLVSPDSKLVEITS